MKRYYELCITHIDWDVDPGETPTLPTSINKYTVVVDNVDELDDEVVKVLTKEYGRCIKTINFVINTISFKLTKKHKLHYINKTYTDPNFKKIFTDLINYKWRFIYYNNTTPGEYEVELNIEGVNQDMLSLEYAEDILKETI